MRCIVEAYRLVTMSNLICSACYKKIQKDSEIVCKICQCKLHKFCAKIDSDRAVNALASFNNIVYNCDNCLQSGCELVKKVSLLAYEIDELKSLFSQFISSYNKNNNTSNSSHRSFPLTQTGFEHVSRSNLSSNESKNAVVVCANPSLPNDVGSASSKTVRIAVEDTVGDAGAAPGAAAAVGCNSVNNAVVSLLNDDVFSDAVSEVALGGSVANVGWTNVTRRKHTKRRAVVGMNTNSELDVVTNKKWVHLASFKPTVTVDRIISYVSDHLKVDKDNISCYSLVKKDVPTENLKYVNFKLGVDPKLYNELFKPELWTANIKIRPFKFFPRIKPQQEIV